MFLTPAASLVGGLPYQSCTDNSEGVIVEILVGTFIKTGKICRCC